MNSEFEIIHQKAQDLGRGFSLLTAGAVMVLLKWVLPTVAPVALAAYGVYRLFSKDFAESAVALGLAVILWYVQGAVGGVLWLIGAGMAGFGVFYLIRGFRGKNLIEERD